MTDMVFLSEIFVLKLSVFLAFFEDKSVFGVYKKKEAFSQFPLGKSKEKEV